MEVPWKEKSGNNSGKEVVISVPCMFLKCDFVGKECCVCGLFVVVGVNQKTRFSNIKLHLAVNLDY